MASLHNRFSASPPAERDSGLRALGPGHAVHESGYHVTYSRYAVTYFEGEIQLQLAAEIDADGVLVVQKAAVDPEVWERIAGALDFLVVRWSRDGGA